MTRQIWKPVDLIAGYVMQSLEIKGHRVRDLPRLLGMHPEAFRLGGAVYGLRNLPAGPLPFLSYVGANDDRNPSDPESFNRPPLPAGFANQPLSQEAVIAELRALYRQPGGMLIKFRATGGGQDAQGPTPTEARFPIGAGIREYVLHRPIPFRLLWSWDGATPSERVRLP